MPKQLAEAEVQLQRFLKLSVTLIALGVSAGNGGLKWSMYEDPNVLLRFTVAIACSDCLGGCRLI